MSSALTQETPRKKTRIARLFVPADLKGSSLLPSDRWIVSNVMDIFRTNRELKKGCARIGAFAALALVAAGAGVAVMFASASVLVAGASTMALITAAIFAKKTRDGWKSLKSEILPKVRADIAVRYINAKGAELRGKWKDFFFKKKPTAEKPGVAEEPAVKKAPERKLSAVFDAEAFKAAVKKALPPGKRLPPAPPPPQP
ncbi:MAG: hypothetical protein K8R48_00365 [Alphaproteobacteria bacterium]|nr:hypothetical protein [Alphaproteobacteria bacterium]